MEQNDDSNDYGRTYIIWEWKSEGQVVYDNRVSMYREQEKKNGQSNKQH